MLNVSDFLPMESDLTERIRAVEPKIDKLAEKIRKLEAALGALRLQHREILDNVVRGWLVTIPGATTLRILLWISAKSNGQGGTDEWVSSSFSILGPDKATLVLLNADGEEVEIDQDLLDESLRYLIDSSFSIEEIHRESDTNNDFEYLIEV